MMARVEWQALGFGGEVNGSHGFRGATARHCMTPRRLFAGGDSLGDDRRHQAIDADALILGFTGFRPASLHTSRQFAQRFPALRDRLLDRLPDMHPGMSWRSGNPAFSAN